MVFYVIGLAIRLIIWIYLEKEILKEKRNKYKAALYLIEPASNYSKITSIKGNLIKNPYK
jgi:hypothetical protein